MTVRDTILNAARDLIGVPYQLGGTSRLGLDCSGLVLVSYQRAGLSLPRTTGDQWRASTKVNDPKPGDLVFFWLSDASDPSHVGIVVRPGTMLHAPSEGQTVREQLLDGWWLDPTHKATYARPAVLSRAESASQPQSGAGGKRVAVQDVRAQFPVRTDFPETYGTRDLAGIVGVTLHWTAAPASQTVKAIYDYQVSWAAAPQTGADQPFPGLAYTYVVDGQGRPYYVNDLSTQVWHSAGPSRNRTRIGLVYMGNTGGYPTPQQVDGLAESIVHAEMLLGRRFGADMIEGHRDGWPGTACPGPAWPAFKPQLLAAIEQARRDNQPPAPTPLPSGGQWASIGDFLVANPSYGKLRPDVPAALVDVGWGQVALCAPTTEHRNGVVVVRRNFKGMVSVAPFDG